MTHSKTNICNKLAGIVFIYLLTIACLTGIPSAQAGSYTAVQDGAWDNPATWGGTIPTSTDHIMIPVTVSVSIPTILTVNRDGTTIIDGILTNNGYLDNNGELTNNGYFYNEDIVVNNTTGYFYNNGMFNSSAFNNSSYFYN